MLGPKRRHSTAREWNFLDYASALLFILPAYFANSSPVVFGGGKKIDYGKNFYDGRRVFGEGKTWKGLVAGVAFGTLCAIILSLLDNLYLPALPFREKVVVGLLLSCGTMAGDLVGSFVKRRLAIAQGSQHEFYDQLLFLGGALAFASPAFLPPLETILFLIAVTYILHKAFNYLAHALKLKKVPW